MYRMKWIYLCVFLLITSCATTGSSDYKDQTKENGGYHFGHDIFAKQVNGFFILIKKIQGQWKLIAKSPDPSYIKTAYKDVGGEVFMINTHTQYITYYSRSDYNKKFRLVPVPVDEDLNCEAKYKHNICSSPFVTRSGMGMLQTLMTLGMDSTKYFDIEGAYSALKEANAFQKLDYYAEACDKAKIVINNYLQNKIIVKPIIEDKTGFYSGGNITTISKKYTLPPSCDLGKAKFIVTTSFNDASYQADSKEITNELSYKKDKQYVRPKFTLVKRHMRSGFKDPIKKKDKYLSTRISNIQHKRYSSVEVDFSFSNRSQSYLTIKNISFYAGDIITTIKLKNSLSLPPNALDTYTMNINDHTVTKLFIKNMSKKQAIKSTLSVGFSVLYNINNRNKTLFAKRNVPYINAFQ